MFWGKNKLKKAYNEGLMAIQLSLYEIFVSILKDELSNEYSETEIKDAAAITVNKLGIRPEDRPDPAIANDKLARSISSITGLTMIKEATAMILLFDYFISDKTDKERYEKAKNLGGGAFETMMNLLDIDKTSAKKIRSISAAMSNKLHETALFDIRNRI